MLSIDPNLNPAAEAALLLAGRLIAEHQPAHFRATLELNQSRCRQLADLPYRCAPYFTEDQGLWEYARRRLAWMEAQ